MNWPACFCSMLTLHSVPDVRSFYPHLEYTLESCRRVSSLPERTRRDLACTLVEASRFPPMKWRRLMLRHATKLMQDLDDWQLHAGLAASQCLYDRLSRLDMKEATRKLDLVEGPSRIDRRTNFNMGQIALQRALNCVQFEELTAAEKTLLAWEPLKNDASPSEVAVSVRKYILLGRISRLQGDFVSSKDRLQRARRAAIQERTIKFDEAWGDLTCELADSLRELGEYSEAEQYLVEEQSRRCRTDSRAQSDPAVELSLAEALFAQERYDKAEQLCSAMRSRTLLRLPKLRLHITLAKIRQLQLDYAGAVPEWAAALAAIREFPLTNGRATRIIIRSMCHCLSHLGESTILAQSRSQMESIDALAKPGGTYYWIPGLWRWEEYLSQLDVRSHM